MADHVNGQDSPGPVTDRSGEAAKPPQAIDADNHVSLVPGQGRIQLGDDGCPPGLNCGAERAVVAGGRLPGEGVIEDPEQAGRLFPEGLHRVVMSMPAPGPGQRERFTIGRSRPGRDTRKNRAPPSGSAAS